MSKKLIVPLWSDYVDAGRLLAKLQSQKGYEIKKTLGLTNDVLIALSARRIGATAITQNRKDFEAIQSVKNFKLKIVS
jgi:predicted nucleic acid-binding protein